jgi:hypothetical protein
MSQWLGWITGLILFLQPETSMAQQFACGGGLCIYFGSTCKTCNPGTYNPPSNWFLACEAEGVCTLCPVNTWQGNMGASGCNNCPAGTDTRGATSRWDVTQCIKCQNGYVSEGGALSCHTCPAGTWIWMSGAFDRCIQCNPGKLILSNPNIFGVR